MGVHQKKMGQKVISFLAALGDLLGYYVVLEDPMFAGDQTSPQLDVSWRKDRYARFPLFIFEVESEPTKSASDNAMKVFSRKTPDFQKPLFFFHVFVEQSIGKQRIDYLESNYDKSNYATYRISSSESCHQLLFDVLDQHFRLDSRLDLYSLVRLLEGQDVLDITSDTVLHQLVEIEYDHFEHSNFLIILETLIANYNYPAVRRFYLPYLERYVSVNYPRQSYPFLTSFGYSFVAHFSLLLLLDEKPRFREIFEQLMIIEQSFQPLSLWGANFGLSQDHDTLMVSEFPILLCLLCAAFSSSGFAHYFSAKLRDIVAKIRSPYNLHGLIWLLIASQIAHDEESYTFAQSAINKQGGVAFDVIAAPTVSMDVVPDSRLLLTERLSRIPAYPNWKEWLSQQGCIGCDDIDILVSIIDGLLIMNEWQEGRANIAAFCLGKSLG